MKVYRLLSILTTLLNNDLVSAKDLADKNEVSIKTIQRDIETLNMAGIPVFSEKGMRGGYGILDSYKFDTKLLSSFEVGVLNSILEGLRNIYDNKQLEVLWEKFEYALNSVPNNDRVQMKIDLSPWNQDESVSLKVKTLSDAIKNKSLLNIEYCNIEGISSKRQIEPYGLKMKSGRWYLKAYCLNRNEFRIFKVNRIVGLEITEQHFIEKDYNEFDNEKMRSNDSEKKILKFTNRSYPRVVDIFNDDEISRLNEEYITVTTYLRNDTWLLSMILSFGNQVEVIEPESLIIDVKKMIRKMNDLYK
ncbi:YafY family protein [Wukongibacter baidiensis]|uniref:helix-turn-helix transcriptional regulator n=1 Tax=Wukongibacter baidiensis TaxID=1723361 RepID=UPI003D7F77D4